jgi:hypothetical protein
MSLTRSKTNLNQLTGGMILDRYVNAIIEVPDRTPHARATIVLRRPEHFVYVDCVHLRLEFFEERRGYVGSLVVKRDAPWMPRRH